MSERRPLRPFSRAALAAETEAEREPQGPQGENNGPERAVAGATRQAPGRRPSV